jgi:hypothetical protein
VSKKRRAGKRRGQKRPSGVQRRSPNDEPSGGRTGGPVDVPGEGSTSGDVPDDGGELLIAVWKDSRAGARAGRGFHFQDAVGAWLAAQLASGELSNSVLIPEGFEDLWLEGGAPTHVQVKSRVERSGSFPVGVASRHILKAWSRHARRGFSDQQLVVVLERGVEGERELDGVDQPLQDSLPADSPLRQKLREQAERDGLTGSEVDQVMAATVVFGPSWEALTADTIRHLRTMADLPPAALLYLARDLRLSVAEAADANATAGLENRASLGRTELVASIERLVEHMDLDALEFAIHEGICEPLDLTISSTPDDRFYEGMATQPGHASAGLVVPRPDLVAEVLAGLEQLGAAVLTGPSGVGKSAVLWTVPQAQPGVLWFRVRRLADADVPALIRLARAYGATPATPVGFLVDAAGTGDFRGWARLRAEAAAVAGLLLVATARREDLMALGDLSECATIGVQLDEAAAATIFEGLVRRGVTTAPHWREAFETAEGLTMEFTHLLTRGRRLDQVVGEQIRVRIEEDRWSELRLLSLVSVADRWSSVLPMESATDACDATGLELRQAISRLAEEHLLVERDGILTGLHPLRSAAITRAVHAQPPPTLSTTLKAVLRALPFEQLHRFIANALRDEPQLASDVIGTEDLLSGGIDRVVGYLHGLRLADFYNLATSWREIARDHEISPSAQPVLFMFATAELEFPDFFPASLEAAREAMVSASGTAYRDELVHELGLDELAALLVATNDLGAATRLLSTLDGYGEGLASEAVELLSEDAPLVESLVCCSVDELGDCLAAARGCGTALATLLQDQIGGELEVLSRIRAQNPWITDLDVRNVDGHTVGYGRLLHASDELQGDPRERAVGLGRLLLRCLPHIDRVDVQALLPGGNELTFGDFTHGVSGLHRRYDRPRLETAWNQARMRAAHTLLGESHTERLAAALPLLEETAELTRVVGTTLLRGGNAGTGSDQLGERVARLHAQALALKPPLGGVELGDTGLADERGVPTSDSLSGLITDLTGNVFGRVTHRDTYPALAAYLHDTVIGKNLKKAQHEPWQLIGIDDHPPSLDDLEDMLSDLHAVVDELSRDDADIAKIGRAARTGSRWRALARAAETCRRMSRRRAQTRRSELERACHGIGLRTQVLMPDPERSGAAADIAVTIELSSLLEWPQALQRIETSLADRQPGETFLVVPLRDRRPVPSVAARMITSTWPAQDLGDWAQAFELPHPTKLTDLFQRAHGALQLLSGVTTLPEAQQGHEDVTKVVESAVSDFNTARNEITALPRDPVIDELIAVLDSHASRVQAEIDGEAQEGGLAEDVSAGLLQNAPRAAFHELVGARTFALEWDIDKARAVKLLATLDEEDPG